MTVENTAFDLRAFDFDAFATATSTSQYGTVAGYTEVFGGPSLFDPPSGGPSNGIVNGDEYFLDVKTGAFTIDDAGIVTGTTLPATFDLEIWDTSAGDWTQVSGTVAYVLGIDGAAITFAGGDISITGAAPALSIEAGTVALTGGDVSLSFGGTILTVEPAAATLTGLDISLNFLPDLSISPRPLVFSGGNLELSSIEEPIQSARRAIAF